jgi:uncharacterized membrane protein
MLVFAMECIDMSRPVQLIPGISLTSVIFPAQENGMADFAAMVATGAAKLESSNSVRLLEFVLNNC